MRFALNHRQDYIFDMRINILTPLAHRHVTAGEKFQWDVTGILEGTPQPALMGNYIFQTMAVFVPYRIVWNAFINFLTEEAPGANVPLVANGACRPMFERLPGTLAVDDPSTQFSVLPRRSYARTWAYLFPDLMKVVGLDSDLLITAETTADTFTDYNTLASTPTTFLEALGRMRPINQLANAAVPETWLTSDIFTVVANQIDLEQLDRRLRANPKKRIDMLVSETYLRTLAKNGVQVRETLPQDPVVLASRTEVSEYQMYDDRSDTGLRNRFRKVIHPFGMSVPSRFYPEPGIVIALGAFRIPHVFNRAMPSAAHAISPKHFIVPDDMLSHEVVDSNRYFGVPVANEPDAIVPTNAMLTRGQYYDFSADGVFQTAFSSIDSITEVSRYTIAQTAALGGATSHVCSTQAIATGRTPWPDSVTDRV